MSSRSSPKIQQGSADFPDTYCYLFGSIASPFSRLSFTINYLLAALASVVLAAFPLQLSVDWL